MPARTPAARPSAPRRWRGGAVAALLAVGLTGAAGAGTAAAATPTPRPVPTAATPAPTIPPQPVPRAPGRAPAALEDPAPYVPATSCDYRVQPGVAAFAALLQRTYRGTGSSGIVTSCAGEGMVSEHTEGRAFDWTVNRADPVQNAQVQALFAWLLAPDAAGRPAANARRLGLMYVIWDKHLLGTFGLQDGWRDYRCSGVTGCHQDHVHFSFSWAGARGVTSFWTGRVAPVDYGPCRHAGQTFAASRTGANPAPCPRASGLPVSHPLVRQVLSLRTTRLAPGARGAAVVALQRSLGGVATDGVYGPRTVDLLTTFQRRRGLPVTGTVGPADWSALLDQLTGGVLGAPRPTPAPSTRPTAAPSASPSPRPVGSPAPAPTADAARAHGAVRPRA